MTKPLLYLSLPLLTQCSKCKDNDPSPEAQLPPATQTGANTFGCLINGEAFTPAGRVGLDDNLSFEYDPTFSGGTFSLQTYRAGGGHQQGIVLVAAPILSTGTYSFNLPGPAAAQLAYTDTRLPDPCDEIYSEATFTYRRGTLTITRLDNTAGIVSGTFDVTFARAGCDTIRFTNGRFDLKR